MLSPAQEADLERAANAAARLGEIVDDPEADLGDIDPDDLERVLEAFEFLQNASEALGLWGRRTAP